MSKYFNRGHYGLQSVTERLSKEWSASDLKQQASLYLDFANGEYFTRSLSDSGTPKQFGDILTFTRDSDKTGFAPVGLATVGADVPALPFDPATGERLGISIHGQRTNVIANSQDLTANTWGGTAIRPNPPVLYRNIGFTEIFEDDSGTVGTNTVTQNPSPTVVAGQPFTLSVYVRNPDPNRILWLQATSSTGEQTVIYFNFSNLSVGGAVGIRQHIGHEFIQIEENLYYCEARFLPSQSGTVGSFAGSSNANVQSYVKEGKMCFELGQFQFETNSAFASPPIITSGTAVTRLADNCRILDIDQSDWWNPNEFTVIVEVETDLPFSQLPQNQNGVLWFNNQVALRGVGLRLKSSATQGSLVVRDDTAINEVLFDVSPSASRFKFAFSVNQLGHVFISNNGNPTVSQSSNTVSPVIERLTVGLQQAGGPTQNLNGTIKSLTYTPRAMTAEELQQASKLGA